MRLNYIIDSTDYSVQQIPSAMVKPYKQSQESSGFRQCPPFLVAGHMVSVNKAGEIGLQILNVQKDITNILSINLGISKFLSSLASS